MLNFFLFIFLGFFPLIYHEPRSDIDIALGKILNVATKKLKNKELYAIGTGGGAPCGKINLVAIDFNYDKPINIESARRLIIECSNELLNIINKNKNNANYFEKFPATTESIDISIFSTSPNFSDPKYVEVVNNFNGKIIYKINNPKNIQGPFLRIKEETFEEAQTIVSQETGPP